MRRIYGLLMVLCAATHASAQEPGRVSPAATGSVSVVSGDSLRETPTASALEAIRDLVPGIDILPSGNLPGRSLSVTIRGPRDNFGVNGPLYVLDGVPVLVGITEVPIDAIAAIRVLKDAAATALYGSNGANGVVELRTRTGEGAPVRFRVNGFYGPQQVRSRAQLMTGAEFAEYRRESYRALGQTLTDAYMFNADELASIQQNLSTDWQGQIARAGSVRALGLSAGGTSAGTSFHLTANAFGQTGNTLAQQYRRYDVAGSLLRERGRLRLGARFLGSTAKQEVDAGNQAWSAAIIANPLGAARDASGALVPHPGGDPLASNPLRLIEGTSDGVDRTRLNGSVFADVALLKALHWRTTVAGDRASARDRYAVAANSAYPFSSQDRMSETAERLLQYTLETGLGFARTLGAHAVDAAVAYGVQQQRDSVKLLSATRMASDASLYYGTGGTSSSSRTATTSWKQSWYLARLDYALLGRYLVSLTGRSDADERLSRFGRQTTSALGLGWRLADEPFIRAWHLFSELKLRGSYGRTEPGASVVLLSAGSSQQPNLPVTASEKLKQVNVGLDVGLLQGRLAATADLYRRDDEGQYTGASLFTGGGYSSGYLPGLSVRNSGLELAMSAQPLRRWHGVSWSAALSLTHNRNELLALPYADTAGCPANARPCDLANSRFIGQPLPISNDWRYRDFYDFKAIGIWQTASPDGARPGDIRVADLNGDGVISFRDRTLLGNTQPSWYAGLTNDLTFGSLDLSILAAARHGYLIQDGLLMNSTFGRYNGVVQDYWTPANPGGTAPRPIGQTPTPYQITQSYRSGSHWRIREATLGYQLPSSLLGSGRPSVRIHATARDPWVSGGFGGYDPESSTTAGVPPYRTLAFGVTATF